MLAWIIILNLVKTMGGRLFVAASNGQVNMFIL